MPHCTPCGAPSYSDPCASCAGKARDALERGEAAPAMVPTQAAQAVAPQPNGNPPTLGDYPRWRAFQEHFVALRNGVAGAANFNPNEWQMLEEMVADLATRGLGQPVFLPAQPPVAPQQPAQAPAAPAVASPAAAAPVASAPPAPPQAPAPTTEAPPAPPATPPAGQTE